VFQYSKERAQIAYTHLYRSFNYLRLGTLQRGTHTKGCELLLCGKTLPTEAGVGSSKESLRRGFAEEDLVGQ
jgi:hypothetical protein